MKFWLVAFILAISPLFSYSQSVPFPSSQGRDYNAIEPYGYQSTGTNWDTSPFLPFIYHGNWFRMMLPNGVTWNPTTKQFINSNSGQTYPIILFFHGRGEAGNDNNRQLVHGGERHKNAVLSGEFPGILLYPQSIGYVGGKEILDKVIAELPVDINRIYVHGLSNGGAETWKFLLNYPTVAAASFPMSAADPGAKVEAMLYTPLRQSQGELDTNPSPGSSAPIVQWFKDNGGHLEYFFLPGIGHGTWNAMYSRADFFPWFLSHKKNQPQVRYDGNLVCPDANISVVMGFTPGFSAYEWRKDGQPFGGNTFKITATQMGSYTGRFRRTANANSWTPWSDPIVVGSKPASITPAIQVGAGESLYIPDADGTSAVALSLPAGFQSYTWNKSGSPEAVGVTQTVTVTSTGNYTATITETDGCPTVPSVPSAPITVIDANGPNKPDAPSNLQASGQSLTSIRVTWEDNPAPTIQETGYELFRSESLTGPYALVTTLGADVTTYTNVNLSENKWYYYKIRAIGPTSASAFSEAYGAITQVDITPPTPPNNLTRSNVTSTSLRLNWNASSDNIGVTGYEVYIKEYPTANWVLAYTTGPTTLLQNIYQLPTGKFYNFMVKAKDASGNKSEQSTETYFGSQPSFTTGVRYQQYVGSWTTLPNFSSLTPVAQGYMTNFSISPRTQEDNFGFVHTAALMIQAEATYTFYLKSDEGSKLYINNTLVVTNDGIHNNSQEKNGTITLPIGYHEIRVEYFDRTGTQSLTVNWAATSVGISKGTIPNANLFRDINQMAGYLPLPLTPIAPSNLTLTAMSFSSIRLNIPAYLGSGTALEIYRSTNGSTWYLHTSIAPTPTATTYLHEDLNPSTRYYYRMRAINATAASGYTSSVNTFTQSLPSVPGAPNGLTASNITANSVTLTWSDNSITEDNFEVYKSIGNNTSYLLLTTLPANTTSYVDNTLFAHTPYFYKVRAKNAGGNSQYSNEITFPSLNSVPQLNPVGNLFVKHSIEHSLPLTAIDPDGDLIIIGSNNLPEFAGIDDFGDGTAQLVINATAAQQGTYPGLEIFAKDLFGGTQTITFTLVVNNNSTPVIADPGAITVKENFVSTVNVTATDADLDIVTWAVVDSPSFLTVTPTGNTLAMRFAPNLNDSGNYNITVTATDPTGSVATRIIPVTISDYVPNFTVKINLRNNDDNSTISSNQGWNNLTLGTVTPSTWLFPMPSNGGTSGVLNTTDGTNSGITVTSTGSWSASNQGITPGVYGTSVNKGFWYYQAPGSGRSFRLNGLNPTGKYSISLLSSRANDGTNNRMTIYAIGSATQQIQANGNSNQLVVFENLVPNANGEIVVGVTAGTGGPGSNYAIVNAIVVESLYDAGEVPPAPTNLTAQVISSQIKLNWLDNSSTETGFEVHRGQDGVNFAKVATVLPNVSNYTDLDPALVIGQTYYYQVTAVNAIGASAFTNTASVVAPNHEPVFAAIPPITMGENDFIYVTVDATDADNDPLTFTLENEPYFMWSEYGDENSVALAFSPFDGDNGVYNFLLHADDTHGARTTASITVTVSSPGEISVKVNFTVGTSLAAAPWNNFTGLAANSVMTNLKDDNNVNTTMSLTLQTGWTTSNPNGYNTGNNSGLFPDAVMRNSHYVDNSPTRNILLAGLNPAKTYDFTFFASRMEDGGGATTARNANYTIGLKTSTLNASNNTSNVAKINGIKSNASGQVTIAVAKDAGSSFGYLGALVIREYEGVDVPKVPDAPVNLSSQVISRTSIKLSWVDASDNETGFEVWRSQANNQNYQLVTTVAANAVTYTNNSLSNGTQYYYKVRAINDVGPSLYTNETQGTTFNYAVSVNFYNNSGNQSGWNNYNTHNTPIPWANQTISNNLTDDAGGSTGISMTVITPFAGTNPDGMTTGNNSGIVPDRVMTGSWWIDPRGTAQLRFGNLSFLRKYNFSFFASRNGTGDRTTVYMIGAQSVSLNAAMNTSNIVQIKDVVPDPDGTITVTVTTTQYAMFGYLNGLIIQAIPNNNPGAREKADPTNESGDTTPLVASIQASPNPFNDRFVVNMNGAADGPVSMTLMSSTGIIAFQGESRSGDSQVEVQLDESLAAGIYLLRLTDKTGQFHTIRLLKK